MYSVIIFKNIANHDLTLNKQKLCLLRMRSCSSRSLDVSYDDAPLVTLVKVTKAQYQGKKLHIAPCTCAVLLTKFSFLSL